MKTKKNDLINLHLRLKIWRKQYKITLQQLATYLKLSPSAISYWEVGTNQMKLKHLIRILELVNSPPPSDLPTSNKLAAVQSPTPTESPPEIVLPVEVSQTVAKG